MVTPLSALKFGVIAPRRDRAAVRVGALVGHRCDVVDRHVEVDGDPEPHVVHRLAGPALAPAVAARVEVALGIQEVRLNVPQAIFAFVTFAFDGALVHQRAGSGFR